MFKAFKRWLKPSKEEYTQQAEKYVDRAIDEAGGIDAAWEAVKGVHEQIRQEKDKAKGVAESLTVGELSSNVNWIGIERVGKYLSPIGNDRKHVIVLTKAKRKAGIITVAEIKCTNTIYSEWVQCLCETMWHLEHKVLEDIDGNKYPVGQMLDMQCSIKYK